MDMASALTSSSSSAAGSSGAGGWLMSHSMAISTLLVPT